MPRCRCLWMTDTDSLDGAGCFERPAFVVFCAALLAPVIAHGLWRPLVHALGPAGNASTVTLAALAVSGAMAVAQAFRKRLSPLCLLVLGGLVSVVATVGGALALPGLVTLLIVSSASAFFLPRLSARLPATLDGLARRHTLLFVLYALLALATVVKTAHLSIFMGDSTRVDRQVVPGEKFLATHSCLTAYVHADALSRQRLDNLYDESLWAGSEGIAAAPATAENPYRPFLLDYYAYPPPFLLVMAPLSRFSGDFAAQRALWFGANGLLLAVGLWLVARWLAGPGTHRILLLAPLFFGSLPVLATLQIGNFQIAVVSLAVLAMVAFHRDRPALGGALLAFAILSKISPGILGIVLLAQRRWRSALWTAAFGVLWLALSVLTLGVQPMRAFLTYTLGRLSSGAAFGFLDDTLFNITTNLAPFGLPFKLQLIGLDVGDPWVLARRMGRVYTVALVTLAAIASRHSRDRRSQAMMWLSLVVLAALQSPFAPAYVAIGLLWAITLLSVEIRNIVSGFFLVSLWLLLTVFPPVPDPTMLAILSVLRSLFTLALPAWLIVRAARQPAPPAPPAEPAALGTQR